MKSNDKLKNLVKYLNIYLINLDSSCTEHNGNTVVGYCKNHNKNYCIRCNHYNKIIKKLKKN